MAKKARLTEFNQGNIIETAEKLFREKGLAQTTMDDIAREAEYSKSTIYVYFKSKEEIFNHIVCKSMRMLKENLSKAIEESDDYEKVFLGLCNVLVEFQKEYPLYFESIAGKIGCGKTDFIEQPILYEVYNVGEDINLMLIGIIEDGKRSGYFRNDLEPLSTVLVLWAGICGIITMASQKEVYLEEQVLIQKSKFLAYGFNMLLHSLGKEN